MNWISALTARLRPRLQCLIRGHEWVLWIDPTRIYLECLRCTNESVGWTCGPSPVPRKVGKGDATGKDLN